MDFSLSSSLVGNAVLNPDKLSLDLQFAADKTLTARKGPTPVFTRASTATFVDSAGLIKYGDENLALQSENFGTSWVNVTGNSLVLNDALSPTNTLTADRIDFPATAATGLNRTLQQSFGTAFNNNGPITASVWLKTVSGTSTVYLSLIDGSATWVRLHTACNVTTEWTRFSVTLPNSVSALFFSIGPDTRTDRGTPVQPSVQAAASVYAWGAQLERSSTARAYIPTTTAAVYGPRFDHDPVTLACKGLLIEESRTNFILQSENFGTTWQVNNASMTLNTVVAPDGSTTADRLNEDTANSNHQVIQSVGSLTAGQPCTISVFAKAATHTTFQIATSFAVFGNNLFANFILTGSGSVGASSGVTTRIENYPNGWYRCSITIASITGGTGGFVQIAGNNNNSSALRLTPYIGTSAQVVHLWGGQLEAGSFATSYIPTVASSVVRSADVCSITGSAFTGFYNSTSGTLLSEAVVANLIGNNRGIVQIDNGTNESILRHVYSSGDGGFRSTIRAGGDTPTVLSIILGTASTIQKRIIAYEGTSFASVTNGGAVATATRTMPTGLNAMKIGNLADGSFYLSGHIAAIRYYKKRLPNAKLSSLTV